MSIKIAVLTATRAEYGLLKPVILSLKENNSFDVSVLVTGAHLSDDFGSTYKEIENDGIDIAVKIPILTGEDSSKGISDSMAKAISGFASHFEKQKYDALLVLGDRYETLAVCIAAMNARIPIIHLHGGETTQGAIDEAVRHSITKMSFLHFTSNEAHRKRVIQLGENPKRVFNVGAVGVENAMKLHLLTKTELEKSIDFDLGESYSMVTFHPVTLESGAIVKQFEQLKMALDAFPDMKYIITKANADAGGREINRLVDEYCDSHENVIAFQSMGVLRYLSAVKYSKAVIGNSSSGIIEVPSFGVPTVNIGDRQKGRMQAESIINCDCVSSEIIDSMTIAFSNSFRDRIKNVTNPYGDGNTTDRIIYIIKDLFENGKVELKKEFYDVDFKLSE